MSWHKRLLIKRAGSQMEEIFPFDYEPMRTVKQYICQTIKRKKSEGKNVSTVWLYYSLLKVCIQFYFTVTL